jgi:hypothetical protein
MMYGRVIIDYHQSIDDERLKKEHADERDDG